MSSPGTKEMNTNVSKARCSQELKHNKNQNAILTRKTKALGAVEWSSCVQHGSWGVQHSLHHATIEVIFYKKIVKAVNMLCSQSATAHSLSSWAQWYLHHNNTSFLHHRVQLISSSSKSADILPCCRNTVDI